MCTTATEHIYGDAAMMSAVRQGGVLHSAQTAQMAREAIYDLIAGLPAGVDTHPAGAQIAGPAFTARDLLNCVIW
jgi:hypothetical protein